MAEQQEKPLSKEDAERDGVDEYNSLYTKQCQCGWTTEVVTQKDDMPEYYTDVGVRCAGCSKIVSFSLPVN